MKDYVNQNNDGFSNTEVSARKYGSNEFEKSAFDQFEPGSSLDTSNGDTFRFARSLFSGNATSGRFKGFVDNVSSQLEQYALSAQNLESIIEECRDAEGFVFINGCRVPGIFQGFRVKGGVITEAFKHQEARDKIFTDKKNFKKDPNDPEKEIYTGPKLFQIDKGVKPFSGSASFVFLDDIYSTSIQKAREFVRIMTFYAEGIDAAKDKGLKRVFRIESFLIGADRPFNFSSIKITDYGCEMDNAIEGKMTASFDFEQYELFEDEAQVRKPDSKNNKNDSGRNLIDLSVDFNPMTDEGITIEDVAFPT